MDSTEKIEDISICSECGGMCCLKSGCDYSANDFEDKSYKALLEILSEGKISVVAAVLFDELANGKTVPGFFLYLRARNCNRDIIDLVSMKTRCSMLTDSGCSYSYKERPTGGKNLVPVRGGVGFCYPKDDPREIIDSWLPYQKTLRRIVKNYTGKSVEAKAREDVEELFYQVLCDNFYEVMPTEMEDLKEFIPVLKKAYPEEVCNAKKRKAANKCMVLNVLQFKGKQKD